MEAILPFAVHLERQEQEKRKRIAAELPTDEELKQAIAERFANSPTLQQAAPLFGGPDNLRDIGYRFHRGLRDATINARLRA